LAGDAGFSSDLSRFLTAAAADCFFPESLRPSPEPLSSLSSRLERRLALASLRSEDGDL
jgi:hypothetical protein